MLIRCSDRGLQNVSRGQGRNSPLPKDASYASGAALSEILPAILHAVMNNGYLKAQCCRNHVFSERASCPRQIMHLSPSQGTFIESLLFRRAREHPAPASMTRTCNIMRTTPHRFANDHHRGQAASGSLSLPKR